MNIECNYSEHRESGSGFEYFDAKMYVYIHFMYIYIARYPVVTSLLDVSLALRHLG